MSAHCHDCHHDHSAPGHSHDAPASADPRYRRILWIALIVNAAMFVVELGAGTQSGSASLLADAIASGRTVFAFGASHAFILAEELVYRAGGLMLVNPIYPHGMNLSVRPLTATSRLERLPGLALRRLGENGTLRRTAVPNYILCHMSRKRQLPNPARQIIGLAGASALFIMPQRTLLFIRHKQQNSCSSASEGHTEQPAKDILS